MMEAEASTAPAEWGDADLQDDADWVSDEPEAPRVRPTPARLRWQIALAIVGLAVFISLVWVWIESASADLTGWLIMLVVLLAIILVAEILLFAPVSDRLFNRLPRNLPAPEDESSFVVGCPGCGTVFTVTEDELAVGEFACQNCGRQGYVKDEDLSESAIQEETCTTCGNKYFEYLEYSECPICHTYNEY